MAYDPALDERVIGVRAWAENHEDQYVVDLVESMTDWQISDEIKFTRSPEGAVAKFMRNWDLEPEVEYTPREKAIPTSLRGVEDHEFAAVVFQEMDKDHKPKVCPKCFMIGAAGTGACDCPESQTAPMPIWTTPARVQVAG